MNIFRFEWRKQIASTLIWSACMVGLLGLFMLMYPMIAEQQEAYRNIMSSFPEAARRMLGIMETDITTLSGFYSYTFLFLMIVGGVQATKLGLSVLSEEMRCRTTDFLLAKPVKRYMIVTAKLLASFVHLLITNVVVTGMTLLLFYLYFRDAYQASEIFTVSITLLPVQCFFMSLGALVAVLLNKMKNVMALALGITFFFYFFQVVASTLGETSLSYLTPFAYYPPDQIFQHEGYQLSLCIMNVVTVVVFLLVTYRIYQKKNLSAL